MKASTYFTLVELATLRPKLCDELIDRGTPVTIALDLARGVCRADLGGAYLSNMQSRADDRGVREELDAVVERMERDGTESAV